MPHNNRAPNTEQAADIRGLFDFRDQSAGVRGIIGVSYASVAGSPPVAAGAIISRRYHYRSFITKSI